MTQLAIIEARDLQKGDVAIDPPTGAAMEITHVSVSDTGVFIQFADSTISTLPLATQVTIRARTTPLPVAATSDYDQAKAIHRDRITALIQHYRDALEQPHQDGITADHFALMAVAGNIQANLAQFDDVERRAQFAMRAWAFAIQALAEQAVPQLVDIPAMPPGFAAENERLIASATEQLDGLLEQYERCVQTITASGGGDADIVASFGLYLDNDINPGLLSLLMIAAIQRIRAQGDALAEFGLTLIEQADRDAQQRPASDRGVSLCAFEVQKGDLLLEPGPRGVYITGVSEDPAGAQVHLWYGPGVCHTFDRTRTVTVQRAAGPARA